MFNLKDTKDDGGFTPIPPQDYPAFIEKAEWLTSKAGADYLNIKFKIFGEVYANRVVFHILNLMHPKDQVKNIAMVDLKRMMVAAGFNEDKLTFTSKEELIDALLTVRVTIKVGIKKDEYGEKNIIKGYSPLSEESSQLFNKDEIPF